MPDGGLVVRGAGDAPESVIGSLDWCNLKPFPYRFLLWNENGVRQSASPTALWTLRDMRWIHVDTPLNRTLEFPSLTLEKLLIPSSKLFERRLTIEMV